MMFNFPVPPSIRHSSGDLPVVLNVQVGKSVTLECESNAVPPPIISWYKNGRPITETANLRILADGQMLELRETEVSVRTLAGFSFSLVVSFVLNVQVPLIFTSKNKDELLFL